MLRRSLPFMVASWRAASDLKHYDLCIVGAGPAGIAAAMRAVDYKKRVCLIERSRVGGRDLWNGALQSKTMWQFSNFFSKLKGDAARRLHGESMESYMAIDEERMLATMREVSETREQQTLKVLEATNVDLVFGHATFTNDYEVQIHNKTAKEYRRVSADYFMIATGAAPREHPFVKSDGHLVVTSDHIMQMPLPESLVIVGAGNTGCEFACMIAGLGKTKVSIIDKSPYMLGREDRDIVDRIEQQMSAAGIVYHHDSILYDMQPWQAAEGEVFGDGSRTKGVQYTIASRKTQELSTYQVDRALIAIGSEPHYEGLGLQTTSLRTRDGQLLVNEHGLCDQTKHIYCVGDASSEAATRFVSVAEERAKQAVDAMYGTAPPLHAPSHSLVSSVVFLTKAVAAVGLNEQECRERNIAYIAARYSFALVGRAVAAADTDGFVKIIVSNDEERTILGVRAFGMGVSTLVELGSLAIRNQQTAFDLADRLTAYPSASQGFQECLRVILGRSAMKPDECDGVSLTEWRPDAYERGPAYQADVRRAQAGKVGGR